MATTSPTVPGARLDGRRHQPEVSTSSSSTKARHECSGNSITAADPSDMWIHEGWATYPWSASTFELHVGSRGCPEVHQTGTSRKSKTPSRSSPRAASTANRRRTCTSRARSSSTRYGAWWTTTAAGGPPHPGLLYQHFKYRNIMTEDVVEYFNRETGMNLTPVFDSVSAPHRASDPGAGVRPNASGTSAIAGRPTSRRSPCRCASEGKTTGKVIRPTTIGRPWETPLPKKTDSRWRRSLLRERISVTG